MRCLSSGHWRSLGSAVASCLLLLAACSTRDEGAPQTAAPRAASQALTVTLWNEGVETTPPAPLTANDVTNIFEYVNGASSTAGTNFVGRISGTPGTSGNVHGGGFGLLFRAQATQALASGVPTYNYEVRKRL